MGSIDAYIETGRKKRHWAWAVACLAIVVSALAVYAFIRPALTWGIECSIPEHAHVDACYEKVGDFSADGSDGMAETVPDADSLTCANASASHVHNAHCYGMWVLVCGMEEHTHTESCFSADNGLNASSGLSVGVDALVGGSSPGEKAASSLPGTLGVSLLYGDGRPQDAHPDGVSYYTHSSMSGYIRLEPIGLETDLVDVTVTLSLPKQYVEKDSVSIPPFSTNSSATQYEILPVTEDEGNYSIGVHFATYDKTQTLVLPFTLSFLDDVVPDNYQLPVVASVSGTDAVTPPNIYTPLYKEWAIDKYVNSNRFTAFSRDGAEVVVTPLEEGGNPYLDDLTYVDFAFVVNSYTNPSCNLSDLRDASEVVLADKLPTYTDVNGVSRIAVFDADKNPGWSLSADGTTVSKTYSGSHSADVLAQIYDDELHLRFPGLPFSVQADGTLAAELDNSVDLVATPSGEAEGETHPTAEDSLRFRMTNDPTTQGLFTKTATKGDIYDVDVYKTNPYPWVISLSNEKAQPLRHIVIQDEKIVEDGEVVLEGLDEALKFVGFESNTAYSKLQPGQTFADIVDEVVAHYTDGTTQSYPVDQVDGSGNFSISFDAEKVCDGYEIVFSDEYEMFYGEKVSFTAYTVYRDPDNTHVPEGGAKVTYANTARSVNSYQRGEETVYAYLKAGHSYDMLPSSEKLMVEKTTLCNDGRTQLVGRGGNHVGDYYLYQVTLSGSLLEPDVMEYDDLRVVDLLPDGVRYDSIYLLQCNRNYPILDGAEKYQPEVVENYHNSGRTAVVFHLNAVNLQRNLAVEKFATLYFWVKIADDARSGKVLNNVYVVGNNLDEYQGATGGTADKYDLNGNGKTDDQVAWSSSEATIIAAQSTYAEKFIAPAGSDDWSKQGIFVKTASDFDYLLKITNETATEYTGLTAYDVLPRIGDENIFATSGRNSEFGVCLREAIDPPDGYAAFYTTSLDVYEKPMSEMVDADIWTRSVSDYSSVTAFKLVAEDGAALAGNSVFQVRIPVCSPAAFGADSMDLLHEKTDADQGSGTLSYLEAVNSFGFRTDQSPSDKESNTVWARVPFAGFCIAKVDSANGEGLADAEFTLTDSQGNVGGTACSDARGRLAFRELAEGDYTLVETKVPSGYADNQVAVPVTITQNPVTMEFSVVFGDGYKGAGTASDPLVVENHAIYTLPASGGEGATVFYALGAALALVALFALAVRKGARSRS